MYTLSRKLISAASAPALALAGTLLAAAPAAAQLPTPAPLEVGELQLVAVDQTVPLAAVLDNACTAQLEAIAFEGTVHLVQQVRQTPGGNLRLIVVERTTLQGSESLLLGGATPPYAVDAASEADVEFMPDSVSLLSYKKVIGTADPFHVVLVLDFDPWSLQLDLRLEGACSDGLPGSPSIE